MTDGKVLRLLMLTGVVAICLGLCCGQTDRPTNVVIIGVDTLRPDHLSCYGYQRSTSANIDALAAGGTLFLNTVSQSPWTLPSFASLLTSLYPHQHGVSSGMSQVRDTFPTLATLLKERGYATGALVNSAVLSPEMELRRGFDFYDYAETDLRLADRTTRDGLAWIDGQQDRPFLLFLHYWDPHEPYAPPAPYDTLYDPSYSGRLGRAFFPHEEFPEVRVADYTKLRDVTPEDWDHIKALYDGEIAFTDRAIGDLVAGLRERRLLGKTLVVLTGDHGEEFFEHQGFGHGHSLFGEVIKVPLLFSCPGVVPKGGRINRQVRTIDIMPTVLDLLGVTTEAQFEGVSLVPLLAGRGEPPSGEGRLLPPSLAYSEGIVRGAQKVSITGHPWKIICDLETNQEAFFNVEQDPGEHHEIVGEKPEAYRSLSETLLSTLFALTDSWYLEIVSDGKARGFDVEIAAEDGPMAGNIYLYRLKDETGHLVPSDAIPPAEYSGSRLVYRDLRPNGRLVLAFKVDAPPGLPTSFDFRIDGERRPDRTFVGDALASSRRLPLSIRGGQTGQRGWGEPAQRPEPPYLLLWRVRGRAASSIPARLGASDKQVLRALGYIQ